MQAVRDDVRVVSPAPRTVWSAILGASEEASACHAPEWLDAACEAGGFEDASRLYEREDGRQLVFPILRRASHVPGVSADWSFPNEWGHGGIFARGHVRAEDVATVLPDIVAPGAGRTIVKPGPFMDAAWRAAPARVRVPHVVHLVDLRSGFSGLWSKRLSSGTRNKVRKAEKSGVEIEWDTTGKLIGDHYRLYLDWTRRRARERNIPSRVALTLARRREPLAVDLAVAGRFGERCRVGIARIAGEPVASMIVLRSGSHANWWRSASDRERMGRSYATYLLLAGALEDAAELGCDHFHMGESGGVASLVEFKEHFGGDRRDYQELRFEPAIAVAAARLRETALPAAAKVASWSSQVRRRAGA
jgi:Acetyltransferase (GNAT) domain